VVHDWGTGPSGRPATADAWSLTNQGEDMPVKRPWCYWHHCRHRSTVTVRFERPHFLAGTRRPYCDWHADWVCRQPGARRWNAKKIPART
jgi:hypothetical protein